jgi:hypothetical protein
MKILKKIEKEKDSIFFKRVEKELKEDEEVLFQFGDKFYHIQESGEGGFDVNVFENEEDIFDEDEEIEFENTVDGGFIDTKKRLIAIKFMID